MRFGKRLHRLWQLRGGVVACALIALLAAVWSVEKVSLTHLRLTPRVAQTATASVSVAIDTPESSLIDLRQDTGSLDVLKSRSVLLGTVMSSEPVRQAIARRAGVPLASLEIAGPIGEQPQVSAQTGGTQAILEPNVVTIRASQTVPLLDVFSSAHTTRTAERIADAAVEETQAYLSAIVAREDTPQKYQIRLLPLGRARGLVVDQGVRWQTPLLAFLVVFGMSCASLIFLVRVRQDWSQAVLSERTARD